MEFRVEIIPVILMLINVASIIALLRFIPRKHVFFAYFKDAIP